MKTTFFNTAIIAIMVFTATLSVKAEEFKRDYDKTFSASESTLLKLSNAYGDVKIENWEKSSIQIKVTVTVNHSKQESAEKLLNLININLNKNGDVIEAITDIDDKFNRSGYWESRRSHNFDVSYEVKAPSYINLELTNKYGSVFIDEILGYANISVKYGTLTAKKIYREKKQPISRISLAYTNKMAHIEEANWLSVEIKYSKLKVGKAHAISAYTKYSTLAVDNASSLVAESKYDNYHIGKLNNFVVTTGAYSNYKVKELHNKTNISAAYSDIIFGDIKSSFRSVEINNKYGSVRLYVDPVASYELFGHSRYGSFTYPESNQVSMISESNEITVNGVVGDSAPSGRIRVNTKYSSVKIRTKER